LAWGESLTTYYDTLQTPDYSPLIVHFTKDKDMVMAKIVEEDHPLFAIRKAPARDRLISILKTRIIHASPMPFLPRHPSAVSFTECIWDALARLAEQYSSYGVVFSKHLIFARGGGPALYMRGDAVKRLAENIPVSIEPFIAPFDPEAVLKPGVPLDYLQEREWRLPSSLAFEYSDLQYVLVESIEDARWVVHQIGAQRLPEEKLIPMEVYRNIRRAWGG